MTYQLINASAHKTGLADESVHCVVTSPPYYGLRAYHGEQNVDWPAMEYMPMAGLSPLVIPSMFCGLGEESTPEAFIGHLILVMREMWRVLRNDGTCFVNLGDSYNGSGGAGGDYGVGGLKEGQPKYPGRKVGTLKSKDLIMIPARFALAAQADGWYLRQDIIWHKTAPMPESVTDRCTKAHEYIYLLTKQPKYYFDNDAIREPLTTISNIRNKSQEKHNSAVLTPIGKGEREWNNPDGRNKRSVWTLGPSSFKGAHFATYPIEIPLTCIKAGSSEHGVCPECLAPWERMVERTPMVISKTERNIERGTRTGTSGTMVSPASTTTTGWRPSCACHEVPGQITEHDYWAAYEPINATVLDPFNGSGTSGRAALQLNRSYIGIDISKQYLEELAPERMSNVQIEMQLS